MNPAKDTAKSTAKDPEKSTARNTATHPAAQRTPTAKNLKRPGVLGLVVTVAFGLSSCAAERPEVSLPARETQTDLAFVESEDTEDPGAAFDFTAPELFTGELVEGGDLFTDSPTIITFVDPNCPVCVSEGPKLAEAAAEHPNVNFVVVHGYSSAQAYAGYVDRSDLYIENMVHLVDSEGTLTNRFGLLFQPSSLLVDGDGNMTVASGSMGVEGINEAVAIITDA